MAMTMNERRPAPHDLIWNRAAETMDRRELQGLQLQRLQQVAARVYETVPFYRQAFDKAGVKPQDIKEMDDIRRLPFTVKTDLRDNYPFALFSTPMEEIVRLHASSGTTGKPIVGAYTQNDLDTWSEVMARSLASAGLTSRDIMQNAYGYGLFTGGLGFHYGAERLGATVLPTASGLTQRQIMLMEDFGSTALACTPSYALVIAEAMEEMGVSKERIKLRVGCFGAEPWTEQMRLEIEEKLGIEAYDVYGLTEIIGPGVAIECHCHDGLHIQEDHFLAEVVDPDTFEPVPYGQKGELVFTSLTKEAFPVIRYRTKDITVLEAEPCACGRTSVRMKKVTGRTDDMLIIRGVNVFPSQIEGVLLQKPEVEPVYQIIVDRVKNLDQIEVQVEVKEEVYARGEEVVREVQEWLTSRLFQTLGLGAKISVVAPKSIQRSEGKAKRVIDRRNLG